MRLARDISILNLVGCLIRVNIHREERLQENLLLPPVDLVANLQLRTVGLQGDILRDLRIQVAPHDLNCRTQRTILDQRKMLHIRDLP